MKKLLPLAAVFLSAALSATAQPVEIVHWDFNSEIPDADPTTGSFNPAINRDTGEPRGTGYSQVVNASYVFANSANEDPWRFVDQSALRTAGYLGTLVGNKTAGVEFYTSTVGYEKISARWLHNNNGGASRYWRVQYTGDGGSTWHDHVIITNGVTTWFWKEVDFYGIRAADNNPNFGFRIVSEFEGTATGTGGGYAPNTAANYSANGTFWLDLVSIEGYEIDPGNSAPTISLLPAQDTFPGIPVSVPFTIGDAEQSPESLTVTWDVWTPELVQNVQVTGSGSSRTITVTPSMISGVASIMVRVTDSNGEYSESLLQVSAHPYPPADAAVAYWDFNSEVMDNDDSTGSFQSRVGTGSAQVIGADYRFQSSATPDPWLVDNSAVRMANFPAAGTGNKTAGIEFRFSTVGYEGITASYLHNNSATGSRYNRVQYTTDGSTWIDHHVIENNSSGWNSFSIDFSGIRAADNNPNFGFRIVTEFEKTALGVGENNYLGSTGNYNVGGTFWVELVKVNGSPLGSSGNNAPTISGLSDQNVRVGQSTGPISFFVDDIETPAGNLTLSWSTPNQALIQDVQFGGSGANRTVTITAAEHTGDALVLIRVTDANGKYSEVPVNVTIRPLNTEPIISSIEHQVILENTTANALVTIADEESAAEELTLSFESSNPTLIPAESITVVGNGSERTLVLTPVAGQAGGAWITVTVSDGVLTASSSFMLRVMRPEVFALWNFNSNPPDDTPSTGTEEPAIGNGTVIVLPPATNSVGSLSAPSFDPEVTDNSKWRLGGFPAQGEGDRTSGPQFMVSTVGYQNIVMNWDHYNSASASRYWRVQYTVDGENFIDYIGITNTTVTAFRPFSVDFASIPEANDNPNFGVRIVSEFEVTSTGEGEARYVAVAEGSGYSPAGTLWLDSVSFSGDPIGGGSGLYLTIEKNGNQVTISWPASVDGTLQSASSLGALDWQDVAIAPETVNDKNVVTITVSGEAQFFRLRN